MDIDTGAGAQGVASSSNLRIDCAGSGTLPTATPVPYTTLFRSSFTVTPATADRLVFTTQPGGATAGAAFATQPVVKSRDPYGNDSTVGLGAGRKSTRALTADAATS